MQLIIPAYNEAARLPRTLRALRRHLASSVIDDVVGPVEVIVVDNASTDDTARGARRASTPALPVRVVGCEVRGKGAAVRAGVAASEDALIGFMDADGATDLGALREAVRLLSEGADIAIGSRVIAGSLTTARHSAMRALGARCYRSLAARLVPGVADTQCGFKVMRGEIARAVLADTRTTGFSFDVEMLARARRAGARIVEFPVAWVDVPGSTFSPVRHGVQSFADLVAIGWRLRTPEAAVPRSVPEFAAPVATSRLDLVAEA